MADAGATPADRDAPPSAPLLRLERDPRLLIEDLQDWVEPLDALEALHGERHRVLLLSGLAGHPASRYSILACDPAVVAVVRGRAVSFSWAPGIVQGVRNLEVGNPFDLLRMIAPAAPGLATQGLPFAGGVIGFLGYGLRRGIESLPPAPAAPMEQPDAWLGFYDRAVIFDHRDARMALVSVDLGPGVLPGGQDRAARRLADLRRRLTGARRRVPTSPEAGPARCSAVLATPRRDYLARIGRALDYIARGHVYQVNLSHRIDCPLVEEPAALFRSLSVRNPAPFAAYLEADPLRIVSASPERFLRLSGDRAESSPIKGTRPRDASEAEDGRLARELVSSAKDRAENVMIADLVRNDLGRVCRAGSVDVERLCALETFATVHHLVSTIGGRLRPDRDAVDLVRALFPGGSMTGAPKVRAMEIIDELEGEERGVYAGSIGYLSLDGTLDLNIVIRTILCGAGRACLRVGGAIVADSSPAQEFRETLDKARALLEALRAEISS